MISVFELFKIGIGPSSSHTVGPMKAAAAFAEGLARRGDLARVAAVEVTLYGSLAFTGRGHATDKAMILGLSGEAPATVDPDAVEAIVARVTTDKMLALAGRRRISFDPAADIRFDFISGAEAPSQHAAILRARRARRGAARRDMVFGRRRLHHSRRRGGGKGWRRGRVSLSVPLLGRSAGPRARKRAVDRTADARQRGGVAAARRSRRACRSRHRGHARLRRPRPVASTGNCRAA